MSKEEQNKAVVGRWFTEFWGKSVDLGSCRSDCRTGPDRGLRERTVHHEAANGPADDDGSEAALAMRGAARAAGDGLAAGDANVDPDVTDKRRA
jgi:hypothetical protein